MSLPPSADVFRSIELKVSQLLSGQLVCPHALGERRSVGEHLTLSEAKDAAARDATDVALRDALWRCVGRDARSDLPNLAQRSQLLALYFVIPYLRKSAGRVSRRLCVDVAEVRSAIVLGALYGLAPATEGDDVRDEVVRSANAAGWAVERADPAERTTDPHSLVDRASRFDDGYSPIRNESDIQVVDETDPWALPCTASGFCASSSPPVRSRYPRVSPTNSTDRRRKPSEPKGKATVAVAGRANAPAQGGRSPRGRRDSWGWLTGCWAPSSSCASQAWRRSTMTGCGVRADRMAWGRSGRLGALNVGPEPTRWPSAVPQKRTGGRPVLETEIRNESFPAVLGISGISR